MTVAIMQPYFFPYIGYFQLIQAANRFILFDDVQYIRHGWINRNRILKPADGIQYIIMPLASHARNTPIKDISPADVPLAEWIFPEAFCLVEETAPDEQSVIRVDVTENQGRQPIVLEFLPVIVIHRRVTRSPVF